MIVRVRYRQDGKNCGGWEAVKEGEEHGTDIYFRIRDAQREARIICRDAGGGEIRTMGMAGAVLFVEEVNVDQ